MKFAFEGFNPGGGVADFLACNKGRANFESVHSGGIL